MKSRRVSLLLLVFVIRLSTASSFTEEERLEEYRARGYKWPVEKFEPDTPGWKKLMTERLKQVSEIQDRSDRFEGYAQTMSAALVQKNYTQFGFGLARAPEDLMEALRKGIHDGLAKGPTEEHHIPAITGTRPWFIRRPDLTNRVLKELHAYPEAWAGMELTPVIAYGFRLYRNQSKLHVHVDKPDTHVISFILHIDSSEDADPWPILIEDLQGNTHEVVLTSGDILFYESSKVFHGRPRPFNGSWYSSVFVHYYPKYGYQNAFDKNAKVYAIPSHWQNAPNSSNETPLQMHGTAFEEPQCPNHWCRTETSNKWSGPGVEGYWIAPTGERFPFHPHESICVDKDERCPDFVKYSPDECDKNPNYMLQFCAKTCGLCSSDGGDEDPSCQDMDDSCRYYLALNANECKKNPKYMLKHCAKSCHACPSSKQDEL